MLLPASVALFYPALSPMTQYFPEPSFRDWALRCGACSCARVIRLLGCLIQFWKYQTDPPIVYAGLSQFPWREPAPAQRDLERPQSKASQSFLAASARKDLLVRAVSDTCQRWSHRGLAFLCTSVTPPAILEATAPISVGPRRLC